MVEIVNKNLRGGCLFTFDGPPIVHYLTKACSRTRYIFPYHLSLDVERTGLGVDPETEMRRLLSRRPTVIISSDRHVMAPNMATGEILHEALVKDYRLVAELPANSRDYQIYALK